MTDTMHRAYFGDGHRSFCLTAQMIIELERSTGIGIGAISRRLIERDFKHVEMLEVIRLAMIGGGEHPQRAAELVETYARARPIEESHLLAIEIINAVWFGGSSDKKDDNGKA